MNFRRLLTAFIASTLALAASAQNIRNEKILTDWEFRHGHDFWSVQGWTKVKVPHDWAIYGPFDSSNDLSPYNGGNMTGRTGGLPYFGKGTYRCELELAPGTLDGRRHILYFDGAMSQAKVIVGGKDVCFWPNGYNAFWCDVTDQLKEGKNLIVVNLENLPESSRWYPGAGLYRKVRHITLPKSHIPVWGTYITTSHVSEESAIVHIRTRVEGLEDGTPVTIKTTIRDNDGNVVLRKGETRRLLKGEIGQRITVNGPQLWSPENPNLYYADTEIYAGAEIKEEWSNGRPVIEACEGSIMIDKVTTRFGIRSLDFIPDKGFFLNGKMRKIKGVCMHHDLGPLGSAVNKTAIRRQLTILKDMGCDAIRTSHNMPAEELVELCDEMGFMVMVESFDEWSIAKCRNGYHRFFSEDSGDGITWAEKDMVNMLHHFRNNPSVIMWSIGNEVESQESAEGAARAQWLAGLCHREDPTRPVTCGMDRFHQPIGNGFAASLDIAGFNYKTDLYPMAYSILPHGLILGSETASTVSSRGSYHFPVEVGPGIRHEDHQCSSYDTEYCAWSNIPDEDFAADEDYPWCIGQFIWTGFDYIGEPTPYYLDSWPNHTSMFGAVDLAYIPKDRFYLYRSVWNKNEPTLHILPHWNWKGREGQVTPVYVYTSYPSAELFVNGKSQGIRTKAKPSGQVPEDELKAMERYRLMWNDVVYQPGELKVVAYDENGAEVMKKTVRTAGKASAIRLSADRKELEADGNDLCFINVSITDDNGNPVPTDNRLINVKVTGAGTFRAMANGDPTCLEPFHKPQMHLFNGQLTVIVQAKGQAGTINVEVSAKGVRKATTTIATTAAAPNIHIKRAGRTMDAIYTKYTADKAQLLRENYPHDGSSKVSNLLPHSSTLSAAVAIMKADPSYETTLKTKVLPGLEKYMDIRRTPAAYSSYLNTSSTSDRNYDENIWLGIDFTDLYLMTGKKEYLEKAEKIWKFVESGIDNNLGGGAYRCEKKKDTKSASSNAPGAVFAAKLYQATDNQDYLDMAKGLYLWTKENLLDEEDNLYKESKSLKDVIDDSKFAYNSGQMIQAGALLFRITGRKVYLDDARKTAKACHEHFFRPFQDEEGKNFRILKEKDIWHHAVMVRGLIDLYHTDGDPAYINDVRKSLEYAWNHARTADGLFHDDMSGENRSTRYSLMTQGAMSEMYARLGSI